MDYLFFDIEHDEQSERWQVVTDHPNLSDRIVFTHSERDPCVLFVNEIKQWEEFIDEFGIAMSIERLQEIAKRW